MQALTEKVREYGANYGMDIYSTPELLSILTGVPANNFPDALEDVFSAPKEIAGIGNSEVMRIFAIQEISNRFMRRKPAIDIIIREPEDAANAAMSHFMGMEEEHLAIMMLDMKNRVKGIKDITVGSISTSIIEPVGVFREAIKHSCASIILLHNHPSGDPTPSRDDILVTERFIKAGNIMNIPVLDHIVIGSNENFVSIKKNNELNWS